MKFEYKVVTVNTYIAGRTSEDDRNSVLEKALNELGSEGWELVSVVDFDSFDVRFFLKRVKMDGKTL